MPEAILFDLDSTIIAPGRSDCWDTVCDRYATELSAHNPEQVLATIKQTYTWYWSDPERHRLGRMDMTKARRAAVSLAFERLGIQDIQLSGAIADAFAAEREAEMVLYPGAIATLTHFRENGIKMGMVTNGASETQRAKIERFNLAGFFDHILVEGEFGMGKPETQVFLSVLDKLEVSPREAWMIGDDLERDIAGAQSAGIYAVWVDWRKTGLDSPSSIIPDRIIGSIAELIESL